MNWSTMDPAGINSVLQALSSQGAMHKQCLQQVTEILCALTALVAQTFQTESKITFIMGLLRGQAIDLATAVWKNQLDMCSFAQDFVIIMLKVLNHPV